MLPSDVEIVRSALAARPLVFRQLLQDMHGLTRLRNLEISIFLPLCNPLSMYLVIRRESMLIFSSIIVWLFGEDQTYSRSDDLVLIHVIIFSLQPSFNFQLLLYTYYTHTMLNIVLLLIPKGIFVYLL